MGKTQTTEAMGQRGGGLASLVLPRENPSTRPRDPSLKRPFAGLEVPVPLWYCWTATLSPGLPAQVLRPFCLPHRPASAP